MSITENLFNRLEEKEDRMIEIRRHLHAHPELSFKEEKTAQYIADFYKGKDVKVTTNIEGENGIVVEINGKAPGRTIGLRADFDALPITEETEVPFKSKNEGVMHACGHDGHTAYLLTLGESLIELKDEWDGTIKLIHQHAEEVPPGGAKSIVASGILDDLDEVYGIHLFPMYETGEVGLVSGNAMAGRSNFNLHIQGSGGHGAMPETTIDPIVAGSHFVTQVQSIVSRRMNPKHTTVVSVTAFEAPGGQNVIQDKVTLRGTVRYMEEENKVPIHDEMVKILNGLETAFGVKCDLDYIYDYPVLYNDPEKTEKVEEILSGSRGGYIKNLAHHDPSSGSEDFSYYLQNTPGTFINVGAKPEGVENAYINHHPKFDINEKSLLISAKVLGEVVLSRLETK